MQTESSKTDWRVRWRFFSSEVVGTAALVFGGLSTVIVMSGDGSPMGRIVPNEGLRMALTAFLFGCIGTAVTLSRVGRESGAHINPAVTMGFWAMRKLDGRSGGRLYPRAVAGRLLWGSSSSGVGIDGPQRRVRRHDSGCGLLNGNGRHG